MEGVVCEECGKAGVVCEKLVAVQNGGFCNDALAA